MDKNEKKSWLWPVILFSGVMLLFDAKSILIGAQEGIEISLQSIVPSLFPFIFISSLASQVISGRKIPVLDKIGKVCGIPQGAESLLLLGLIGGYPVGARLISDNYRSGKLDAYCAQRMLGFCNNAGPAFILGILAPMFSNKIAPYALWIIHMFSAILTGVILPNKKTGQMHPVESTTFSVSVILENTMKAVCNICGWVILFKSLIIVCEHSFLKLLPAEFTVVFSGLLELSNGCISVNRIVNESARFLISGTLLGFGGLCVVMQTKSAVRGLGISQYIQGKLLQTSISFILCFGVSFLLFGWDRQYLTYYWIVLCISALIIVKIFLYFFLMKKKRWHSEEVCCIM